MDIRSRANSYTDWGYSLCQEYDRIIAFMVIILLSLGAYISLISQCEEGFYDGHEGRHSQEDR